MVFIGNPTYLKATFGQLIHDQPISTSQIYHKDFSPLILFVFVKLYPVRIHPFRHQYPSCFSSAISSVSRLKHSEQLSYILPMNLCPQEKHFIFFLSDTTLLHGSPSPAWENQLQWVGDKFAKRYIRFYLRYDDRPRLPQSQIWTAVNYGNDWTGRDSIRQNSGDNTK